MNVDGKPIRTPLCSICGHPAVEEFKPFCSLRCANVDLARWLGGGYVIAGGVIDDDEDGDPKLDSPGGKLHQNPNGETDEA